MRIIRWAAFYILAAEGDGNNLKNKLLTNQQLCGIMLKVDSSTKCF